MALTPGAEQITLETMVILRASLHLALALSLVSLTCGLGAFCADMGEDCCCMMENGASPCTEVSGSGDTPAAPEPEAAIESGERFSVAIIDAGPLATSLAVEAPRGGGRAPRTVATAATALYLSHCALLC